MKENKTLQDIANHQLQKTIGINWKRLRLEHGLSRARLASDYSLSQVLQTRIENLDNNDMHTTSLEHVKLFAQAINMSFEDTINELLKPVPEKILKKIEEETAGDYSSIDIFDHYPYNLFYAINSSSSEDCLYKIDPSSFEKAISVLLTDKEKEVIKYKYKANLSTMEIAEKLSVTREKVINVESQALKKMRQYVDRYKLIPVVTVDRYKKQIYDLEVENKKLRELLNTLSEDPEIIQKANEIKNNKNTNVPIVELGLSLRTYNALMRFSMWSDHKIDTLYDISQMNTYELKRIKGLGKKSYDEILKILHENGLKMNDEKYLQSV